MKQRIPIIFLLFVLCLSVNAQRLNKYGQKMVAKIERYSSRSNRLIESFTFHYDSSNRLIGMDVLDDISGDNFRYKYVVKNGAVHLVTPKTYDRTVGELDANYHITRLTIDETFQGRLTRWVWDIERVVDDVTGIDRPYLAVQTFYVRDRGEKVISKTHNRVEYRYDESLDKNGGNKKYKAVLANDTNVDLAILLSATEFFCNDWSVRDLCLTEWIHGQYRNIYRIANPIGELYFERDSNGNIVKVGVEKEDYLIIVYVPE